MTDHIGELAALYALGALNERERDDVERHVAGCHACIRLLAQAEDDVTVLAATEEQRVAPASLHSRVSAVLVKEPVRPLRQVAPRWQGLLAYAALFALAVVPTGYLAVQNLAMHNTIMAQSTIMADVASAPHKTVAFAGLSNGDAHVLYGPDGSWYFVVMRGVHKPLAVVWPHDGKEIPLGATQTRGDVAMLYLPKSHKMDQLALMDGDRIVAQAQLAY